MDGKDWRNSVYGGRNPHSAYDDMDDIDNDENISDFADAPTFGGEGDSNDSPWSYAHNGSSDNTFGLRTPTGRVYGLPLYQDVTIDGYGADVVSFIRDERTRRELNSRTTSTRYSSAQNLGSTHSILSKNTLVPASRLKQLAGNSYSRAREVIRSNRMADLTCSLDAASNLVLDASVESADFTSSSDYTVHVVVSILQRDIIEHYCSCPAYGRYTRACKHVVALVQYFQTNPNAFDYDDDFVEQFKQIQLGNQLSHSEQLSTTQQSQSNAHDPNKLTTSSSLVSLIRERRYDKQQKHADLLNDLTKRVQQYSDSEFTLAQARNIGIHDEQNSTLTTPIDLELEAQFNYDESWTISFTLYKTNESGIDLTKPKSVGKARVAKIRRTLEAIINNAPLQYNKSLSFVHTREAFVPFAQEVLDFLIRSMQIRDSIISSLFHGESRATITISEGELCELLAICERNHRPIYLNLGFRQNSSSIASFVPTALIDGTPDIGLTLSEISGKSGYKLSYTRPIMKLLSGSGMYWCIVSNESVESHKYFFVNSYTCYRCNHQSFQAATLLNQLGFVWSTTSSLTIAQADLDITLSLLAQPEGPCALASANLPLPKTITSDLSNSREIYAIEACNFVSIPLRMPDGVGGNIRPKARIEFYFDRDLHDITLDIQAVYGDRRYHVYTGLQDDPELRDTESESLALEAARHYMPDPQGAISVLSEEEEGSVYRLLTEGIPLLRTVGQVYATAAFDGLSVTKPTAVRLGIGMRSGLVEVSPLADDISPEEIPELLASLKRRRRFHRLRDGRFIDTSSIDTSELDTVADDLGLSENDLLHQTTLPAYTAAYFDTVIQPEYKDESFVTFAHEIRDTSSATYELPHTLKATLRTYQIEGYRWLRTMVSKHLGGILADEMGLGKTVQTLALLAYNIAQAKDEGSLYRPQLIVCPASLVYNWQQECNKFVPSLVCQPVAGSKSQRTQQLERIRNAQSQQQSQIQSQEQLSSEKLTDFEPHSASATSDVTAADGTVADNTASNSTVPDITMQNSDILPNIIVTSYDLLRRDESVYKQIEFDCMIIDEAQAVKNHATKVSQAVRSMSTQYRFALTGTPIENRLAELWSIMDFVMPGMLGSYRHFRERFEVPILAGDDIAAKRLQNLVGAFILRRRKQQVLRDLPEKIDSLITVTLEGSQRKLYAVLEARLRASVTGQDKEAFNNDKIRILAQLTQLRQVCCDPRLAFEQQSSTKNTSSAKLDAIQELVESCIDSGQKVLIFSQFTSFLELIGQRLSAMAVNYYKITGSTAKAKRLELVDKFNSDATPVFLISLKAGNTGLNLVGASVVIHADPWWNAAAQDQATDRAHRIGQKRDVTVYRIVAKDTIEERIARLQEEKSKLVDQFVDQASSTSSTAAARLTQEGLLALLGAHSS